MNLANWGDMTFTDKDGNQSTWSLQQFNHHSPSEHYYDADSRRLELQFVHYQKVGTQTSSDQLAVLSVSFEATRDGTDNEWLEYFVDDGEVLLNQNLAAAEFNTWINSLNTGNFYNYEGSLTTPGCNENVNWVIVQDAQMASEEQLAAFERAFQGEDYKNGNARDLQKVNDRTIYMKNKPDYAAALGFSAVAAAGAILNLAL